MGFFGSNFSGENKWFSIYLLTMYPFFIPIFFIPPTYWWIIGLIFLFYSLGFFFLRYRIKMGKYEEIQGIKFIDCKLIRDRGYRQDMLLGLEKYDELQLHSGFDKHDKTLSIEEMEEYQIAKTRILTELIQEESPLRSRLTDNEDGSITVDETPLESFGDYNDNTRHKIKHKLFVEKMGELHAYYIKLYEPQSFYDQIKHEFQRFIMVTYGEFEQQFNFSQEYLNVKGYSVKGLVSSGTFIILDWIAHDIPILFLRFAENEAFRMTNHVLDANKIVLVKHKIMERMIYDFRSFFKRFQAQLREEQALTISNEGRASKLFQLLKHHTATTFRGDTIEDIPEGIRIKKWVLVLLSVGWVLAILFAILYFIEKGIV